MIVLGTQPRELFGAHALDVGIVQLPLPLLAPHLRRLHRGARCGRGFQNAQSQFQRVALRCRVMRPAGAIAQRKVREQKTRHAHIFHDVLGAAHDHRGNARSLQRACGERQRLVADGAVGHQHGHVRALGLATLNHQRNIHLQRVPLAAIRRHTMEVFGEPADAPLLHKTAHQRQRKPAIAVLHRGVLAVDAHMRNAHIVIDAGVARVRLVELGRRVVRCARPLRPLVGLERRGRGQQHHRAFR
ncbi:hypothetical protein SDC9_116768 [bioreactor metagenome]|uniref:Uncharacterized protein n=1 Tax=bioreactor metagenome TaxID=1076179 RepID=A0A645BWJ0_9ZZZZ